MGVRRRIISYLIISAVAFFVTSCVVIYQHSSYVSQYFSDSMSALSVLLVYIIGFMVIIGMLFSLFRR